MSTEPKSPVPAEPVKEVVAPKVSKSPKVGKSPKAAKSPKAKSGAKKSAASHPKYEEMIKEAIASLKDRTGSSLYAIANFIQDKHPGLPGSFKKILSTQVKNLVNAGKLVKVKASFKLGDALKVTKKVAKPVKPLEKKAPKSVSAPKPKVVKAAKPAAKKAKVTPTAKKALPATAPAPKKKEAAPKKQKSTPTKKPKSVKSSKPAAKPAAKAKSGKAAKK